MGVKIVPENVSNVAKSEGDNPGMEDGGESFIAIAKGQSFRELLEKNEIAEKDVEAIVTALAELVDLNAIHVGQKVRIASAADVMEDGSVIPLRVSIYDEGAHQATVARTDDNSFVRADEPNARRRRVRRGRRGGRDLHGHDAEALRRGLPDGAGAGGAVTADRAARPHLRL